MNFVNRVIASHPIASALVSAALLFVMFSGRSCGPAYSVNPGQPARVLSRNGRWEVRIFYETPVANSWEASYYVYDREDVSCAWAAGLGLGGRLGPHGAVFLSDDGKQLVTLSPYVDVDRFPYAGFVSFWERTGLKGTLLYGKLCAFPRRLYPFERRPAVAGSPRVWIAAAEMNGKTLYIRTAGLWTYKIDIATRQITARTINYGTIVRWLVFWAICAAPIAVLVYGVRRVFAACLRAWRRRRALAEGRCLTCAYLLYGLPESRCPECGTPFNSSAPRSQPE